MTFHKGESGNPAGKLPGTRNKSTIMAEQLLAGEVEAISRAIIEKAKAGDPTAMRACFDRLVPPRRERAIEFALPPLNSVADAAPALAAVVAALAEGEITPGEAANVVKVIDGYTHALALAQLDVHVRLLEQAKAGEGSKCAG
jgi:hypothetical protein